MTKDEERMFQEAVNEIRSLRRQNELLSAKVDVFDSIMQVLHTSPATKNVGMSPDVAWQIEKHLNNWRQEERQIQNQ